MPPERDNENQGIADVLDLNTITEAIHEIREQGLEPASLIISPAQAAEIRRIEERLASEQLLYPQVGQTIEEQLAESMVNNSYMNSGMVGRVFGVGMYVSDNIPAGSFLTTSGNGEIRPTVRGEVPIGIATAPSQDNGTTWVDLQVRPENMVNLRTEQKEAVKVKKKWKMTRLVEEKIKQLQEG